MRKCPGGISDTAGSIDVYKYGWLASIVDVP